MSSKIKLGEEDEGFQEFEYNGKSIKVDIFDVCQKIEGFQKNKSHYMAQGTSVVDDIVKFLNDAGLENVSKAVAAKFMKYVIAEANELKKNIEQSALSVTSIMDSTPSSCPASTK